MSKKKIDILDMLPSEAIVAVDKLGYDFLSSQGYDVVGAVDSVDKRKKIKEKLKAEGKELTYRGAIDSVTQAILVWYELTSKDNVVRSNGIKFLPKGDGEDDKCRDNKE